MNMLREDAFSAADPGFPVGGTPTRWGRRPLTWVLFGRNVCENERIGSRWGACADSTPWIHH